MNNSSKFTVIKWLKTQNAFKAHIPDFLNITKQTSDQTVEQFIQKGSTILRSSLHDEGSERQMLSGKSLTIKDIHDLASFHSAFSQIKKQPKLAEIILQKQIKHDNHLTIYLEKELFFIESELGSAIITPVAGVGELPHQKEIALFLEKLTAILPEENYLIEMGLVNKGAAIYLYQVNAITPELTHKIFSNPILTNLLNYKNTLIKPKSLFTLISTEYQAYQFRKSDPPNTISSSFKNWGFLLHYLYIFCQVRGKSGSDQDYVDFLNFVQKRESFLSKAVNRHLVMANELNRNSKLNLDFAGTFNRTSSSYYFVGAGTFEGVVEEKCLLMKDFTPSEVYALKNSSKIILTPSNKILGHSYLAAIEQNLLVIGNIPTNLFESIKPRDQFFICFNHHKFELK